MACNAMQIIEFFQKINAQHVGIAGGKGASLGEMTNTGIPVPPGFVVLAPAFDRFLEETDLGVEVEAILKKVNYRDINSVDRASNEIRDLIIKAKMPKDIQKETISAYNQLISKNHGSTSPALRASSPRQGRRDNGYVAVRSSATAEDSKVASWAGELETYLNSTDKNLLQNVKKCWASLYTPRAIFYRHEKKMLKTRVSVAVVVQQMVQSEISGITFTVHPVTEDRDQMLIEAGFGLGEAIVSGSITPDSYVIDKKNNKILDVNIAEQTKMIIKKGAGTEEVSVKPVMRIRQKLSGRQILELAKICQRVEAHYKFPCDIEWAYARGKFYIVQSRPITTLK